MGSAHEVGKTQWRIDVLPKSTKQALDFLATQSWLEKSGWYLAGGTALALYEGHRVSLDLDFFYPQKTFATPQLLSHLSQEGWEVEVAEPGTVFASFAGAKVSFIAYPFFTPKQPWAWYGSIRILHPKDIAVMKVIAVSQRGRKRDFVDLYWYTKKQESLGDILLRLPEQYPTVAHDYHHILKSLMYFGDAQEDPMPKLFFGATWREMKEYFGREVPRITKEFLQIS